MDRPGINRPGRPGNNRPVNIGNIHVGNNNVINNRPSWVNIDRNRVTNMDNRWRNQIGGISNWRTRHPQRRAYWNGWADGVRGRWGHYHQHANWFGPDWWGRHRHTWCGWHYGYGFNNYSWNYWWTAPTFASAASWFTWSAPAAVWSQPVYYDYGQGGNVVYQDNSVYINGQPVATADDFAQSAAALATVAAPSSEEQAAQAEWMALGTFAVSSSEKDVEPTRVIQLAVSREGIVSGTLYNTQTDQAYTVQGRVDPQNQRVAFRVGDSENIIVETGLYNLTQDEAPALVHYGAEQVENWLLVRLDQPEGEQE